MVIYRNITVRSDKVKGKVVKNHNLTEQSFAHLNLGIHIINIDWYKENT
jgi:hypothetical protein